MKNPQKTQKPLKLSNGLNPKTPTSENPDSCIIPHLDNPLTHAAHLMSYLHDILNLG